MATSSQHLYGFVAEIDANHALSAEKLGAKYSITPTGINSLLDRLTCWQCRSLLLTWQMDKLQKAL